MKAILICILFLLSSQTTSFAAEEKNIVLLGTNHVPPFKIVKNDAYSGINADVIKEIFKGTGLKVKIIFCPWKRCLNELEKGRVDVFIGLFKTPEREKVYYFCYPPYKKRSDKAFYLRKGDGQLIQNYEDLYTFKIGVTRGYKNFPRFDSDEKLQKDFVTNHIQNLSKLVSHRIDVFIQTEVAADYLIKQNGYGNQIEKAPYKFAKENPSYFVVSKKSAHMNRVEEFNKNLDAFVKSKKYEQIIQKWIQ